jgi:outer membrane protein assembly factor BamD
MQLRIEKSPYFDVSNSLLRLFFVGALLLPLSLSGCASIKSMLNLSSDKDVNNVNLHKQPETLIIKGMDAFNLGSYDTAEKYFTEILDKYPFSPQAILAELKEADCKYFLEKYSEALLYYKQFEERHPTNEAMPYVMYQKGMCNYNRIDTVDRDPEGAIQAVQDFSQLLRAYPVSPYTDEAKARLRAAKEFLVNHEYFVVKFYLRTGKYKQAATRLKYLIATYPNAMIIPRAKKLLARIEAGNPPSYGIMDWFADLSLPSWKSFFHSKAYNSSDGKKGSD